MSRGVRIVLAVAATLSGIMLVVAAPPTDKAPLFYALGGFCGVLACASLSRGRAAELLISVVGSVVFIAACGYLFRWYEGTSGSR